MIPAKTISIVILTILAMMLSLAIRAQGASVTLRWDPNNPAPDGYRIYQRPVGQAYKYDQPSWTGEGTTGTVAGLIPGTEYYFVVRAFAGDQESADSNEVSFSPAPVMLTADIDGNGCVDAKDLAILSDQYGQCSATK